MPILSAIETDRFVLRRLTVEDAPHYHSLETDPEVKRFLGGPSTMSVQDYEDRIAKGASGLSTTLAVTPKNTGKYLGRCGFTEYTECAETINWEINIVLSRECPKKQGYATEIGLVLIPRGFETLRCQTILGVADAAN
jgi:ribosomal-protein-alanine N-acetyltransferase